MRRLETFALVVACLLALSACGGEAPAGPDPCPNPDPWPPFNDSNSVTVEAEGLRTALPAEYLDLLYIETEFADFDGRWKPLISVYDKASWENSNGTGGGFLFGFAQLDQATFEQMISADGSAMDVFATDGESYYIYTYATDVQFCRPTPDGTIDTESDDWKEWETLNEIGPVVREDFITRNGLQSFSVQDYTSQLSAGDDGLVYMRYYSYFLKDGDTRLYDQLLLRQPARQGEGGVWAVEQWMDELGNQYLYFPDSGKPAAEYYAQLQEECDAGEHPEYLTPAGAAAVFVRDFFGHETADGSFEKVRELDQGYTERNQALSELALDVMFGRDVDDMALLDCVGEATADNWGVLGRYMYGSDWFEPLMDAVSDAAIGEDQASRDVNMMRFFLATQDAATDFRTPLGAVLQSQEKANPEVFNAALSNFPEKDQELLAMYSGLVRTSPVRTQPLTGSGQIGDAPIG